MTRLRLFAGLVALLEKRIPCAPVNNCSEALNDPQVRARNMAVRVSCLEGGDT